MVPKKQFSWCSSMKKTIQYEVNFSKDTTTNQESIKCPDIEDRSDIVPTCPDPSKIIIKLYLTRILSMSNFYLVRIIPIHGLNSASKLKTRKESFPLPITRPHNYR